VSLFLKIGTTRALFYLLGSLPCFKEALSIRVSAGAMPVAVSFRNFEGIPSGPGVLCESRLCNKLFTPAISIWIGGMSGCGCPSSATKDDVLLLSIVNTEEKCLS